MALTAVKNFRAGGFTLLEVLIALLVLSVGLLGLAGLQTVSLKFNHQSYMGTQATVLIDDMVEKITSNPVAARAGSFNNVLDSASSGSFPYGSCPTSCTPEQLAYFDISLWKSEIENPRMLSQGRGKIERVPTPLIGAVTQHVAPKRTWRSSTRIARRPPDSIACARCARTNAA